jgi:hypothetical protein
MSTGSIGLDYLIEDIKKYVTVETLAKAAKGGTQEVKQTIISQYFKEKWLVGAQRRRELEAHPDQGGQMTERRRSAIDSLFKRPWDIQEEIALSADVKQQKAQDIVDVYIMCGAGYKQTRREFMDEGYDEATMWGMYKLRVEELQIKAKTDEAVKNYNYAKRRGLVEALPQDTIDRAKAGMSYRAKSGVMKRKLLGMGAEYK